MIDRTLKMGDKVKIIRTNSRTSPLPYGSGGMSYDIYNIWYDIGDIYEITDLQGLYSRSSVNHDNYYLGKNLTTNVVARIYHGDLELAKPDINILKDDLKYFKGRVKETSEEIERLEKYPDPDDEIVELIEYAIEMNCSNKPYEHKIRQQKLKKAIKLIRNLKE